MFALGMSVYGLLRDFRDAFFISLLGFKALPFAKIASFLFLFFELFLYQKIIVRKGPKKAFFYTLLFYIFVCVCLTTLFSCGYHVPSYMGYLFYVSAEGFPPFIWSSLWILATVINNQNESMDNAFYYSLAAQTGGLVTMYYFGTIGKKFTAVPSAYYTYVLVSVSIMLLIMGFLFYYLTKDVTIDHAVVHDKTIHNKNILSLWKSGFQEILRSRFVGSIVLVMFCWEFVNIVGNYMRISLLSQPLDQGLLLSNMYDSMFITYLIGIICVVLTLVSSRFKNIHPRYFLWLFPFAIGFLAIIFAINLNPQYFVMGYMVLRGLYPSLIFPVKETFFSVTNNKTKFLMKFWIDSFLSRFGKLIASVYINFIYFKYSNQLTILLNLIIVIFIIITLFYTLYYLDSEYEKKLAQQQN